MKNSSQERLPLTYNNM